MKNACFIVPYFGKLPNYFQLFLNSCAPNKNFDWLIFTDDKTDFKFPDNVKKINMQWQEFKNLAQKKFNIKLSLNFPRKLCDFKPTYGYIFEKYIKDYYYWGYCDIDTIMGNLDKMLPLEFLKKYDKLFSLGHMVLFRNNTEINKVFMKSVDGSLFYKHALTSDNITVFDETGNGVENIDTIFVKNGYKVFHADWSYNPRVTPTKFVNVIYDYSSDSFRTEHVMDSICMWNGHDILRYIFISKQIKKEEYLYVHLQQRQMKLSKDVVNARAFTIIPNEFVSVDLPQEISYKFLKKLKKRNFNFHYLKIIWRWKIASKFQKGVKWWKK
ncbi:hypothetical protein IMAU30132_01798 [Lactobacillus helveticus]|uniref:DUF6625 family protein n=1 Tax=Lactobacillus helveticus TaxID=1587 RepID=UPI001562854F|nr:DUF6625 family protein [Lactobacillus helveticus]NRO49426.1 hypothetical protein [Lactobacillus helveticus]